MSTKTIRSVGSAVGAGMQPYPLAKIFGLNWLDLSKIKREL